MLWNGLATQHKIRAVGREIRSSRHRLELEYMAVTPQPASSACASLPRPGSFDNSTIFSGLVLQSPLAPLLEALGLGVEWVLDAASDEKVGNLLAAQPQQRRGLHSKVLEYEMRAACLDSREHVSRPTCRTCAE